MKKRMTVLHALVTIQKFAFSRSARPQCGRSIPRITVCQSAGDPSSVRNLGRSSLLRNTIPRNFVENPVRVQHSLSPTLLWYPMNPWIDSLGSELAAENPCLSIPANGPRKVLDLTAEHSHIARSLLQLVSGHSVPDVVIFLPNPSWDCREGR